MGPADTKEHLVELVELEVQEVGQWVEPNIYMITG